MDSPCEIVRDHSTGHSHLLTGQDELTDPDQAHSMVPGQVLKRTGQSELRQPRLLVLYGVTCTTTQSKERKNNLMTKTKWSATLHSTFNRNINPERQFRVPRFAQIGSSTIYRINDLRMSHYNQKVQQEQRETGHVNMCMWLGGGGGSTKYVPAVWLISKTKTNI